MAGIPDTTTLIKESHQGKRYKETILANTDEEIINHLKNCLNRASEYVREAGGKPIFCTITGMDINKYNRALLMKGQTYTLKHEDKYTLWQHHIDNIIQTTNAHIIKLNREEKVATPHCHSAIRKHRGRSGKHSGHYITDYSMLYDGLHAGDKCKMLWAKAIMGAIKKNQDKYCDVDAPQTEKRHWKGEKRCFSDI